jgi:hypothetical protein
MLIISGDFNLLTAAWNSALCKLLLEYGHAYLHMQIVRKKICDITHTCYLPLRRHKTAGLSLAHLRTSGSQTVIR